MFGTIQFLVYLRYLNLLSKQLISIKDSHRVQLSDSVPYLPCYFHILLAVISEIVSHRAQIILFQTRKWCMSCMIWSLLYMYFYQGAVSIYTWIHIDQGWFLLNVIKSFHFYYKDVVYRWHNRSSITLSDSQ